MKIKKVIAAFVLLFISGFMCYAQSGTGTDVTMQTDADEGVLEPGSGENCESTTVWVPIGIGTFIIHVPVSVEKCES